ncbi:MAG: tol-pal system protein YbgF [Alphaproteobacteria bacterium]|nr:tol-pal system protein YbgF [Alphaproteobacteria bacterium]
MNLLLSPSVRHVTQAAFAACLLMAAIALPSGARAENTDSRLRQLEGSVDTLNRAVFKGESSPLPLSNGVATADYQASVESRLSSLETQLRELTGKIEKQEFENSQLKTRLEKALTDINLRFEDTQNPQTRQSGTLAPNDMGGPVSSSTPSSASDMDKEGGEKSSPPILTSPDTGEETGSAPSENQDEGAPKDINAPASQSSPTVQNLGSMAVAPGGAGISPKNSDATSQYESAFSLLKSGNFTGAKSGFESFIAKNPSHPLISNATYWLGESYYANGEFEKAARIFAESYKKYPKGPKVADSLLKMGMSLGASGKKKEGCIALKQLKKEFPTGNSVTLRRADQEISRFACL